MNQDYKLATKAIAKRLCEVLPSIINQDQTGFIKGRYIGENIFKLQNIMDYADEENLPSIILSVDFEKAFDCLKWDFIESTLRVFKFGPSIIRWIKLFYTDINSKIINNGWLSEEFYPQRGARQGCPLSPYIFIICAEILANQIRNDNQIQGLSIGAKQFLISQYADDTILTLRYNEETLKRVIEIFKWFEQLSGLKVNLDKTEIFPIGPIKNNYQIICPDLEIKWSTGPIKILGVEIYHEYENTIKANYSKALQKIKYHLNMWKLRKLTYFGKIVILNTYVLSQLVYLMSVIPTPPPHILKEIEQNIFLFIWNGPRDKIKRHVLYFKKEYGGLSVPDVITKNKALKMAWIKRIINDNPRTWSSFIYKHTPIKTIDFWNFNLNKSDTNQICKKYHNHFIKDIISFWFEYTYKPLGEIQDCVKQQIIGNSLVRIDNKPIYIQSLLSHGPLTIQDFFDNTGSCMAFDRFVQTQNVNLNFITYYGIITAIPNEWKRQISGQDTNNININRPNNTDIRVLVNNSKICKYIYGKLIEQNTTLSEIKGLQKWKEYFNNLTDQEWLLAINNIYSITQQTELQSFQYKLLHFIVVSNEQLYKWGLVDSDICVWCDEEIETMVHIFIECEVVKIFWEHLKHWIYAKCSLLYHITNKELILGIQNKELYVLNKLYLYAKRFIYVTKCNKQLLSINAFNIYLSKNLLLEREIALAKNNLAQFMTMWHHFL